jgi:hypothetical protein
MMCFLRFALMGGCVAACSALLIGVPVILYSDSIQALRGDPYIRDAPAPMASIRDAVAAAVDRGSVSSSDARMV